MKETDLYPPVKRFLEAQGYEVKAEIHGCDVTAVRGDEAPVIVELKGGFTLQLLLQGIDRQAVTDDVYLAIAEPKRSLRSDLVKLCRRLGLGLIMVRGDSVEALADPAPYTPRRAVKRQTLLLKEFARRVGDPNSGGSTRRPLMTAYRQDALRCARCIAEHGPSKVALIRKTAKVDRTGTILLSDVYGWFQREARGIYGLSAKGTAALTEFAGALRLL
ncbi:MAG: hypothetical protein H7X89_04530 [Rhizobiales bacterium]|nr:hypothetical protein [Hyphomicrobiales bacterium]